jgi:hypothetical protein
MNLTAIHPRRHAEENESEEKSHRIFCQITKAGLFIARSIKWRLWVGCLENLIRNHLSEIKPHAEKTGPDGKLDEREPFHGGRHLSERSHDLADSRRMPAC